MDAYGAVKGINLRDEETSGECPLVRVEYVQEAIAKD